MSIVKTADKDLNANISKTIRMFEKINTEKI